MPTENTASVPDSTASVLRERLSNPLPVDRILVEALPEMVERLQRDLLALAGKPLGKLVLSPATAVSSLQTVKDYCKKLATVRSGQPERDVALTIYFAAIASALAFHGQKISTHPYHRLSTSFDSLAGKAWMAPELADLFRKACHVCRQRS